MPKAILFFENLVDNFQLERFGINYLKKKKFKYKVYNLSAYTRPKFFKSTRKKISYSRNLKNIDEITQEIKSFNKDDIVFFHLGLSIKSLSIIKILNKRKIKFVFFEFGNLPLFSYTLAQKIIIFAKYPLISIRHFVRNKFIRLLSLIYFYPYYYIYAGNISTSKFKSKFFINVPDIDHDRFIIYKRNKNLLNIKKKYSKKKYLLYLETPYNHPDGMYENDRLPPEKVCSYNDYYNPLSKFLKFISAKLKIDIKLFLHPKSNLRKYPIPHSGKIKTYSNLSIFENCKFVCLHNSTAIKFAVLFDKPVIFLSQNNFSIVNQNNIKFLSKYFKQNYINFSEISYYKNLNSKLRLVKNKKIYEKFKKNYICNYKTLKTSYEIYYKKILGIN